MHLNCVCSSSLLMCHNSLLLSNFAFGVICFSAVTSPSLHKIKEKLVLERDTEARDVLLKHEACVLVCFKVLGIKLSSRCRIWIPLVFLFYSKNPQACGLQGIPVLSPLHHLVLLVTNYLLCECL